MLIILTMLKGKYMSRSFKKTPIIKYAPKSNVGQKLANRRVRRFKGDLPTKGYSLLKKIYDPWDVHDVVMRETLEETFDRRTWLLAKGDLNGHDYSYIELNINQAIQQWKKWYWRK